MGAATRRATYEDLLAVPEHLVAEIIDGELVTSPRPAAPHTRASSKLGSALDGFDGPPGGADSPGGWWLLDEPELHIGADVVVPDIAAWRIERMPTIPNAPYFTLAPDWVLEVLSSSTARLDRAKKMGIYARESVGHLWLLDPGTRTLEVYRLESGRWVVASIYGGDDPIRAEPFDAVALDPTRWWLPEVVADR